MNAAQLTHLLHEVLDLYSDREDREDALSDIRKQTISVSNFRDAGVLTNNHGLQLRLEDGTEFQLTIVQSR